MDTCLIIPNLQQPTLSLFVLQAPPSLAEAMILDTEAAVMANFEFLANEEVDMDDDDDMSDDLDEPTDDDQDDVKTAKRKNKVCDGLQYNFILVN